MPTQLCDKRYCVIIGTKSKIPTQLQIIGIYSEIIGTLHYLVHVGSKDGNVEANCL